MLKRAFQNASHSLSACFLIHCVVNRKEVTVYLQLGHLKVMATCKQLTLLREHTGTVKYAFVKHNTLESFTKPQN